MCKIIFYWIFKKMAFFCLSHRLPLEGAFIFFAQKYPLGSFSIVVIFENFFGFLALWGHSRCLPIEEINIFFENYGTFRAFSPPTTWGDVFFWYASVDLIFSQSLREESFKIVFRLIFWTSTFHSQIHIASPKIKLKSLTKGGKNRRSGLSFVKQY